MKYDLTLNSYKDSLIELLGELIQIKSVSGEKGEREISNHIFNFLENNKVTCIKQRVTGHGFNIIALIEGETKQPSLMFQTHVDIVGVDSYTEWLEENPFSGKVLSADKFIRMARKKTPKWNGVYPKGDVIYGRGSADAKASLAAMITTASLIISKGIKPKRSLYFAFTVDEEVNLKGIQELVEWKKFPTIGFVINGEPTCFNGKWGCAISHPGVAWYRIEVKGISGHGSTPWRGKSAVLEAFRLLRLIQDEVSKLEDPNLILRESTVNLGKIISIGGADLNTLTIGQISKFCTENKLNSLGDFITYFRGPNKVPSQCIMHVDIRPRPPYDVKYIDQIIEVLKKNSGIDFEWKRTSPPEVDLKLGRYLDTPPDSELVRALLSAGKDSLENKVINVIPSYGWTEAAALQNAGVKEAVSCGPGYIKNAHKVHEFVEINQAIEAVKLYFDVAHRIIQ